MLFFHENMVKKEGCFTINEEISVIANSVFGSDIYKELWKRYTYESSEISVEETDELIFMIGNVDKPDIDGCEYVINVSSNGLCVVADNVKNLIYGFMTLIDLIKQDDKSELTQIDSCLIKEAAQIKNRMVHFCVFPETELWEIQRFIRLVAVLKYSHIILEFWGMLKFDCLKELSWEHGFSKEAIKPIVDEANALGLEIVPMFNHWGHAAASRVKYGKHVVLDQNISLQKYFNEDGWCWNIKRADVRNLLKNIRTELIDLCGNSSFFHIGCDEAYNFNYSKESMDEICSFINEVSEDLYMQGKRAIMWGDMLLAMRDEYKEAPEKRILYTCGCPDIQNEQYMQSKISKDIIVADWQYYVDEYPVKTSITLKKAGFDVLICPWQDTGWKDKNWKHNKRACIETIKKDAMDGLIYTTWHNLKYIIPSVVEAGVLCWGEIEKGHLSTKTAALLRKVYNANGEYKKSGWSKEQMND